MDNRDNRNTGAVDQRIRFFGCNIGYFETVFDREKSILQKVNPYMVFQLCLGLFYSITYTIVLHEFKPFVSIDEDPRVTDPTADVPGEKKKYFRTENQTVTCEEENIVFVRVYSNEWTFRFYAFACMAVIVSGYILWTLRSGRYNELIVWVAFLENRPVKLSGASTLLLSGCGIYLATRDDRCGLLSVMNG